jgi:hypothetical protein
MTITIPQTISIKNTIHSIYYIQGQLLLQQPLQQEQTEIVISRFAKGVYVIKLNSADNIDVTRIIKG